MSKTQFIDPGPRKPSDAELDAFWDRARKAVPGLGADYQVRWIGIDEETTGLIIAFIKSGEKTGTFTLPWINAAKGQPRSEVGDHIVLIAYDGTPTLAVELTDVRETQFGRITADDTAIDGPPVRALEDWIPLHRRYWSGLLKPYGRTVTDDMPVLIEPFRLLYAEP